jgi:SAM-dependent methyltransferase
MKPLESIYKNNFFSRRYKLHWRAPIFCQAVIDVLNPKSVVDVGCATGDLVKQFREYGLISEGVEGSEHALNYSVIEDTFVHDLRKPLSGSVVFDLCLCLEVAEHIEPEYTRIFLDNLACFSQRILLSIAGPGQGGHYHVNLQPIKYWDDLFLELGYTRNQEIANRVKEKIYAWRYKPGIKAFWNNLVYYEKVNSTP